jgi:hypothetical protein
LIPHLQLAPIRALHFGRKQLVPERRAADHIVRADVPGSDDVTRWNSRACPLDSVRGGGKIDLGDDVEIRHAVIVAMPLLHCLLLARELATSACASGVVCPTEPHWARERWGEAKEMFVIAIIGTALVGGFALALVARPLVGTAVGIALFVAAGAWTATRPDDPPGETLNGAVAWLLAAVWVLLPWLVGVAVGSLIRSRRRSDRVAGHGGL